MSKNFNRAALAAGLLGAVLYVGCTADIHDNTFNLDDLSIDANINGDADNVQAGSTVKLELNAEGAFLIEPNQTPPPDKANIAAHFEVHLDTLQTPPILVTAKTEVDVKITEMVQPGDHKLLCRLVKHDGTPTNVVKEIDIHVSATATVSVGNTNNCQNSNGCGS